MSALSDRYISDYEVDDLNYVTKGLGQALAGFDGHSLRIEFIIDHYSSLSPADKKTATTALRDYHFIPSTFRRAGDYEKVIEIAKNAIADKNIDGAYCLRGTHDELIIDAFFTSNDVAFQTTLLQYYIDDVDTLYSIVFNETLDISLRTLALDSFHFLNNNEHFDDLINLLSRNDPIIAPLQAQLCHELTPYTQFRSNDALRKNIIALGGLDYAQNLAKNGSTPELKQEAQGLVDSLLGRK